MKVSTTKGLVCADALTVKDIVSLQENSRVTATEWYLGTELVRRDVNINVLRGLEDSSVQQNNVG